MKYGDRKYEDRIFGHKKTAQARIGEFWVQKNRHRHASGNFGHKKTGKGRHRGILGTKKPAEAGIEEFWTQKNRHRPSSRNYGHKKNRLKPAAWMVRLSGLEPPTPTMSR